MDIFQLMKILQSLSYKVTFIPEDNLAFFGRYTQDLQRIGVECLYAPYIKSIESYLEKSGDLFDIVILFRVRSAAKHIDHVRRFCPNAKIVFDTVDVHYLREERQAETENSAALRRHAAETKRIELETMRKADATILLSSAEYSILKKEAPEAKLFRIPLFRDIPGSSTTFGARKDIVFVGGFQHLPNVDAVQYFVAEIWPLVRQRVEGVKFYIVGSNPPPDVCGLATDDIIVTGYVEDLSVYLNNCRVSVAPLRYGAGIKGKIVSSLSHGVPCVATSLAVEGMDMKPEEQILVADEPQAFADAMVELYSNESLWQKLSDNGLEYVKDSFSISAGRTRIARLLADIGAKTVSGNCDDRPPRNENRRVG